MSVYCKAYKISKLKQFSGWVEKLNSNENNSKKLDDNIYLYLHDNYYVTDSIFKDENIIYDDISEDWITFCNEILKFEIPSDILIKQSKTD